MGPSKSPIMQDYGTMGGNNNAETSNSIAFPSRKNE